MNENHFRLYGKPLRLLRISNDLKAIKVAEALSVSVGFYANCEAGRRKLSVKKTSEFLNLIGYPNTTQGNLSQL